ncbi:hypothetical protein EPO17_00190 [Patescibacteria group bacterium]|nr:MAG: hypothetical protein EPO17_00190 [Patescibacteria group bacterium]
MQFYQKQFEARKNAGYTMLFAVLVSTVLLSIGIFILNVSKKEVLLSAIGRESALAFYAADGGVECAHYHNVASPTLFNVASNGSTVAGSISCGGQTVTIPVTTAVSGVTGIVAPANRQNKVEFNIDAISFCAKVTVTKNYTYVAAVPATETSPGSDASYSLVSTTIDSRGYNTCDATDPRRVERGLRETIQ